MGFIDKEIGFSMEFRLGFYERKVVGWIFDLDLEIGC